MKPQELWNTLSAADFARQAEMPAIAPRAPWYMEVALFLALWIGAAIIVLAFVIFYERESSVMLFSGVALGALACWLFRARRGHFFLIQLAHAASLCGAGLILSASAMMLMEYINRDDALFFYLLLAFSLLVFCVMNNFAQRLAAAFAALFAIALICHAHWRDQVLWLDWLYIAFSFNFVLVWWMEMNTRHYRHGQLWRSVGYALALALFLMLFCWALAPELRPFADARENATAYDLLMLRLLPGLALFWFAALLLRRESVALNRPLALILMSAVLCVVLLGIKMPFIAVALLILITGFAVNAPVLLGIGIIMLLAVFAQYYYWLEVSLLEKSIYLLLTGGILLLCRLALLKSLSSLQSRAREEGDHV
ncbi:MAG: DUF4401 domain-containing protein [Zoogloeaceae bacterium]|jgi:hypothetical protein|nr:DUF4401 domain-containing protein [Zoogloeaceae bacterium]